MKIQNPTITQITELKGDGANLTGSFSGSIDASSFSSDGTGLVSGSGQIPALLPSGTVSGSAQTIANLPSGTVSGSAQTVANLPSGTVSGSGQISLSGFDTDNLSEGSTNKYASTTNVKTALDASLGGAATIGDSSDTITIAGNLTVSGTKTELQVTNLNVEDLNITVASGSANAAAANGAGLTVDGASATLTYASSGDKWVFNKVVDVPTSGLLINSTAVTSTAAELNYLDGADSSISTLSLPDNTTISTFGASLVDDADAAAARTTLGVDAAGTVNYTHPTHPGDDFSIDTGALTGATVISDLDINVTTDALGHVTDANGSVATRTLTLANLGYTGATDANNYAITDDNTSNVHFEGLMVGQTTGATANTIRCIGDIVAYYSSDAQFKDNVETLEGALDKVKAIRGVRFDWNDKQDVFEGHDIGVIAQEVEAVLPELVHYREHSDSKAVDYVKLTAVLIEAVKELSAKVDELSK